MESMDDDGDEDDDGWCDTVDDSRFLWERYAISLMGWRSLVGEEVDSRGEEMSSEKNDLWL